MQPHTTSFAQGPAQIAPSAALNANTNTVRAMSLTKQQPGVGAMATVSGNALGSGPSNNGFVAGTANID